MEFLTPGFLFLLPLAFLPWFVAAWRTDWLRVGLRSLILLLVVFALAQPARIQEQDNGHAVWILDTSESVSKDQQALARERLKSMQAQLADLSSQTMILIGRSEQDVEWLQSFDDVYRLDRRLGGSPLQEALTLGAGCIPAEEGGFMTLLSDGTTTNRSASAEEVVESLVGRNIPMHSLALSSLQDVRITEVFSESLLRVGHPVRIGVRVEGPLAKIAMTLHQTGKEAALATLPEVEVEENRVLWLEFEPDEAGFIELEARMKVLEGSNAKIESDRYRQPFAVQDPLPVLYLGERIEGGRDALAGVVGEGFDLQELADLNQELELEDWPLVVLDDRRAESVPQAVQERLLNAITDQGLGLLMTGGNGSLGPGGWFDTPVAAALPVEMMQKEEKRDPSTTLVIIIDTSGSMGGNRVQLAKEVARLAMRRLLPHDKCGIVEFYGAKRWAAPIQPASNTIELQRALNRMDAGGGTVILPAIEEAFYGMQNVRTRYKHVLVLTDGGVETGPFESLLRRMTDKGITTSTVLIGPQAHSEFLVNVANWGKGRFYNVPNRFNLPEVLLKQPASAKLPAYRPGEHALRGTGSKAWWGDADPTTIPNLSGYVETRTRPQAQVLLETVEGSNPILSTWRYGVGRVTVMTTEPTGPGTVEWEDWDGFGDLMSQVLARTADAQATPFAWRLHRSGYQAKLIAERRWPSRALPQAKVMNPNAPTLEFLETAPGRFVATFAIPLDQTLRIEAGADRDRSPRTRLVAAAYADQAPEFQVRQKHIWNLAAISERTGGMDLGRPGSVGSLVGSGDSRRLIPWFPWLLFFALLTYFMELIWRRRPSGPAIAARGALLFACTLLSTSAVAQDLEPSLQAKLVTAIERNGAKGSWQDLYVASLIEYGDLKSVYQALAEQEQEHPLAARWVRLHLLQRQGDLTDAMEVADQILENREAISEEQVKAVLQTKARLQDATGMRAEAQDTYTELLPFLSEDEQIEVRLRMALLEMQGGEDSKDALAKFAKEEGRDANLRNRAAIVLALLARPADAIELFVVDEKDPKRFRQEIRIAEWAVRADDAERAQDYAWRARVSAQLNRDRFYALAILVQAHRMDDSLQTLIDKFAGASDLDDASKQTWIDLLRETDQLDAAIELFAASGEGENRFDTSMRRELLEMYREAGREEEMVEAYRKLVADEPHRVEWPEGLSRYYLEHGDEQQAQDLWKPWLERTEPGSLLLAGASALKSLGQDAMAIAAAERCIAADKDRYSAYLFLFGLHRDRGRLPESETILDRLHAAADPDSAVRMQLAEGYEQLGNLERAIEVLEGIREVRGPEEVGEDLELRLAWLHSEAGHEDIALDRWRELWRKVKSIPRRRYVEDRMMTVASRLGRLADIAIELEEKLVAGEADSRDAGLLVRLYTKVADPVSASEVIEESLKQRGGSEIEALQEKARVFLSCTDYHNYERTVRDLIKLDPEGEADYLRQIAMSMLERGKPDQARELLIRLKELESEADSAEFEAGVLALAGLRREAIVAYRRGIAREPDRIESFLLMANLMREVGERNRAIGMFQYLAETAEKDDLFTVAIDGLLNLEAPEAILKWARRITLQRLAQRHDKMYLYQLLSDLSEQLADRPGQYAALENSLPIAGDRRAAVLRELMDLAKGSGPSFGRPRPPAEPERHLDYGRRLIGLNQIVPPQVYLDLGEAFLQSQDVKNAAKTFQMASDLPDPMLFKRETAALFERSRYVEQALRDFESVLVGDAGNVSLFAKIGELNEQLGQDAEALDLYKRGLELLLSRLSLVTTKEEGDLLDTSDPFMYFGARNIDDFDRYFTRLRTGLMVVMPPSQAQAWFEEQERKLYAELEHALEQASSLEESPPFRRFPRLLRRAELIRRAAFSYGLGVQMDRVDLELLRAFPEDAEILDEWVRVRLRWGRIGSARYLMSACGRPEEQIDSLRFLVGEGGEASAVDLVPAAEVVRLFLPLLAAERFDEARDLIRRADFKDVDADGLSDMNALFSAALYLDDPGLTLSLSQRWIRLIFKNYQGSYSYIIGQVLDRARSALNAELRRSLYQYLAMQVLEEPEKRGECVRLFPELQKELEEPLIEEEQLLELVEEHASRLYFGLGPILKLLPANDRASILRSVWPDIQPTMRARFLLQIVEELDEPFSEEFNNLLVESFAEALESADQYYTYDLINLADGKAAKINVTTILEIYDAVLKKKQDDVLTLALRAAVLAKNGRAEEALDQAVEIYVERLDLNGGDYEAHSARRHIEQGFLPQHIDAFFAYFDKLDDSLGVDLERTQRRLDLLRQVNDSQRALEETKKAWDKHPEDEGLRDRYRMALISAGRPLEALDLLEEIAAEKPDDKGLAGHRYRQWKARRHAPRALEAFEVLHAKGEEGEEEAQTGSIPPEVQEMIDAGLVELTPELLEALGMSGMPEEKEDDGRLLPPNIGSIKTKLIDENKPEAARSELRRLWRKYPSEDRDRMFVVFHSSRRSSSLVWPEDEKEEVEDEEEVEEEEEPSRGGLEDYKEWMEPEKKETRAAWNVLAEHEIGVRELRARLRAAEPLAMESLGEVFDGLIVARNLEQGAKAARDEFLEMAQVGAAGKADYVQLLALLQNEPDLLDGSTTDFLSDLARTIHPRDTAQLRRLAQVYAAAEDFRTSMLWYRWCATQTNASRYFSYQREEFQSIPAHLLVAEVKKALGDGEEAIEVIEAILKFSAPAGSYWERQGYENLVLETWIELLGPQRAFERCASILAEADSRDFGLRRSVAKKAAWLYAIQGKVERFISCLEVGLCKFDPSEFMTEYGPSYGADYPQSLSSRDFAQLIPENPEAWKDPIAVWQALGHALIDWMEEDRINTQGGFRGAVLCGYRLAENGETDAGREILSRLAQFEQVQPHSLLWLVDAARAAGDEELADRKERFLFARGQLHVERIPEVVGRTLEEQGAEAALRLGEKAAEHCRHPELLNYIARASEQLNDPEGAIHWQTVAYEALAAEEHLKEREREIEEEAKRKREEAEKKKKAGR